MINDNYTFIIVTTVGFLLIFYPLTMYIEYCSDTAKYYPREMLEYIIK